MTLISFKKIARFMEVNTTTTIKNIFGKTKYKDINKMRLFIENHPDIYTTGVTPLTVHNLEEFYVLYKQSIATKHNAKIYNLLEIYTPQILAWQQLYFSFVKEHNKIIAGSISCLKTLKWKPTLVGCVKASIPTSNLPWALYYVEYLFFTLGLNLHVQQFCAGKDRNCYGTLWESIWLAIHKLQNHYLPYQSSDKQEFTIEEVNIKNETLLFVPNLSKNKICDHAILRTNKTLPQIETDFLLLTKRWISLDIRPLSSD